MRCALTLSSLTLLLAACGDDDAMPGDGGAPDAAIDSGEDAGVVEPRSTDHCDFTALAPTAGAGGTVTEGALEAGAAERVLGMSVGSALGAYTARADFMGSVAPVDRRFVELAGSFKPSVGIETFPRARALALRAGGETVLIVKADLALADDWITYELEERLGAEFAGKVIFATSHSHSAWGHYGSNSALQVGIGRRRAHAYSGLLDDLEGVSRDALAALAPARIGIAHDGAFDPENRVNRDRRSENDDLPNGANRDDHDLFVVRVDAAGDGSPIAVVVVFGMHGTILDADNALATTDAPGAVERALEESFDTEVVVMHLQGAAGDVSPAGTGGVSCDGRPGPCYDFARAESVGRHARDAILAAWTDAGKDARDALEMEMVTRSVHLGPDWRTFTVRGGALEYAPFDGVRPADRVVFDGADAIVSPIDEFNAPVGAAFCGEEGDALFDRGQLPGTIGVPVYSSCVSADVATEALAVVIDLEFEDMPVCAITRTTVSALRVGDHVLVTVPGEPVTLFADYVRELSPVAPERTIVVGYAQGHTGYVLRPEDWLRGGYEPTITFWGPLQGEYLAERADELMDLVMTPEREDATEAGTDRYDPPDVDDTAMVPPADPAPMAGTVPDPVPELVYVRGGEPLASAQPDATVPRLGSARFAWIGNDPLASTPRVTIQRATSPGVFEDLRRRSGRVVVDGEMLLFHTPDPLIRSGTTGRTHYWVIEWQPVVPWGTDGLDALADRPGLPLGRYRFHVEDEGYALDSEAFDVVAAALEVAASVTGTTVTATAHYHAPGGFRLLAQDGRSNEPVPVATGPVTVELLLAAGGASTYADLTPDASGTVTFDAGADAALTTGVRVVDRFGNVGETAL
jgi:neutral ceramidase